MTAKNMTDIIEKKGIQMATESRNFQRRTEREDDVIMDMITRIIQMISKDGMKGNGLLRKNSFWCPKVFQKGSNSYDGFVLYICGGHALDVYQEENSIHIAAFGIDYVKYFMKGENDSKGKEEGEAIRESLTDTIECSKRLPQKWISVLSNSALWEKIYIAFNKWATKDKNSQYERMRQTRICYDSENEDNFCVFTMEEKFGNAEVDMIAMKTNGNKHTLTFIEYKCTEKAVTGEPSFAKHYSDYAAIIKSPENLQKTIDLYNRKRVLLGKSRVNLTPGDVNVEIAFLLSNVVLGTMSEKEEKDKCKQVSLESIKKKLKELVDINVKVLIMKYHDVDVTITSPRIKFMLSEAAETTMDSIVAMPF